MWVIVETEVYVEIAVASKKADGFPDISSSEVDQHGDLCLSSLACLEHGVKIEYSTGENLDEFEGTRPFVFADYCKVKNLIKIKFN